MHTEWFTRHGFLLIWVLTQISQAILFPDLTNNNDDDLLQETLSEASRYSQQRTQETPFPQLNDFNDYITDLSKRADTPPQVEDTSGVTAVSTKPSKGGKAEAENIVGDMKKYGLWEYTTDTTGMGEQIKEMMSKSQDSVDAELSPQSLLKHADKMNEEINKYAEQAPTMVPTIDPYDTPLGYTTPAITAEIKAEKPSSGSSAGVESVDVVTIPNQLTIEDEHGNNLDNLKQSSFKDSADKETDKDAEKDGADKDVEKNEPTKSSMLPMDLNPTHPRSLPTPSSNVARQKSPSPTTALTLKLLNALKGSKTFLQNAEKLLASPNDSELELYQKQKNLVKYLEAYESENKKGGKLEESATAKEEKAAKTQSAKLKAASKHEKPTPAPKPNSKLLDLLNAWMASGHPTAKLSATNIKPSVAHIKKTTEEPKSQEDLNLSIQSPSGTAEKPIELETPGKSIKTSKKVNDKKGDKHKTQDKIQSELLESIFQLNGNKKNDGGTLPDEQQLKQFFHSKEQSFEATGHPKDETHSSLEHHITTENSDSKNTERQMLAQLGKMLLKEKEKEKAENTKQQKIDLEKINDMQKLLDDNKDENMAEHISLQHKAEDEGTDDVITGKLIADANGKSEKEENEEKLEKLEKLKMKELESESLKKIGKEEEKVTTGAEKADSHNDENKIEEALMKELEDNKLGKFSKDAAEEKKLKSLEEGHKQKVHAKTTHDESLGNKVYNYLKNTDEFKKLMADHLEALKDKPAPVIKEMKETKGTKEMEEAKEVTFSEKETSSEKGSLSEKVTSSDKETSDEKGKASEKEMSSDKGSAAEKGASNEKGASSEKDDERMAALENEKVHLEKEEKEIESLKAESSKTNDEKADHAHLKESEKTKAPAAENEGEKMNPAILKQLEELKEEKERLRLKEEKLKKIEEEINKNKKELAMTNFKNSTDDNDEVNHKIHLANPLEPLQNVTRAMSKFADSVETKTEKHGSANAEPSLDVPIEDTAVHDIQVINLNAHQAGESPAEKTVSLKGEESPSLQSEETNSKQVDSSSLNGIKSHEIHQSDESSHDEQKSTSHSVENESHLVDTKGASNVVEESTEHTNEDKMIKKIESYSDSPQKLISEKSSSSATSSSPTEEDNSDVKVVQHHTKKYISSIFSPETQSKLPDDKMVSKIEGAVNSDENKIITKHEVGLKDSLKNKLETTSAADESGEKERRLTFGARLGNKVENSNGVEATADTMSEGDLNQEIKSLTSSKLNIKDETNELSKISKFSEGTHIKPIISAVEKPIRGPKSLTFHIGNNDIHINSPFKTLDVKHIINKQTTDAGETRDNVKSSSSLDDNKLHITSKLKSLGSVVLKDLKMFQQVINQKNTDDVTAATATKKALTSTKETCNDDVDELSHVTKHCDKTKSGTNKADKASFLPIHNPAPEEEFDDFLPTPKTKVLHFSNKNNISPSTSSNSKKPAVGTKQTEKAIARKLIPTTLAKELVSLESHLIPDENGVKHHSDISKMLKLRAESMFGHHKADGVQPEVNTEVQTASLTKHKHKDALQLDTTGEEESASLTKHKHKTNTVEISTDPGVQTASLDTNKQENIVQTGSEVEPETASLVTPKSKANTESEVNTESEAALFTKHSNKNNEPTTEVNTGSEAASFTKHSNKNNEPATEANMETEVASYKKKDKQTDNVQQVINKESQTASFVKPKHKEIQQEGTADTETVSLTHYRQIDPIQTETMTDSTTASLLKPPHENNVQSEANHEVETASLTKHKHKNTLQSEANVEDPAATLVNPQPHDTVQPETNTEEQTAALLKPAINNIISPPELSSEEESASLVKHISPKYFDVTASKRHLPRKHSPSATSSRFPKTSLRQSIYKYLIAKKHAASILTPRDALMMFPSNANSKHKIEHQHFKFNSSAVNEPPLTPMDDSKLKPVNNAVNTSTDIENKMLLPGQSTASSSSSVDPGDITRSVLPKKTKDNANNTLIEDVFNILGSEDQISYRSNVTHPNLDEIDKMKH